MPTAAREPILYDADCGFCRWSLALVLRWDRARRLRPVALQSPEGEQLLAELPLAERRRSAHLVTSAGQVLSGGAAAAELARRLPGGAPFALMADALPRPVDRTYRLVADHRGWFGRPLSARAKARATALIAQRS